MFLAGALFLALSSVAGAVNLPPGFQLRTLPFPAATAPNWDNGLQKPTTLEFAPDGKIFIAERNGRVLEFDSKEDTTPTLVLSILDKVMAKGDRGILGMKLDPEYPTKPYIYLSYTYDAPIGGDSSLSTHTHYSDGGDECEEAVNNGVDCLVSGRLARIKINPATSVAVGGPEDPTSEEVLVNSWCQQASSHSIGDIEFDSEGALLMGGGDGANWVTLDYGQLGNPCNDPPNEGGSLRAQDLKTPATKNDPTDYSGSIIRVNRETGAAMPNNPLAENPLFGEGKEDVAARRLLTEGNRNPYRFTIQPGTSNVYIGDVGMDLWEEINRVTSPPKPGQGLTNFGWPCYEGGPSGNLVQERWKAAEEEQGKPFCAFLYNNPASVTAPFFAYPHPQTPGYNGRLFPGDACEPWAGSAIAGLAFYDPTGVEAEDLYPPEYRGALFFSDAARGCIWTMEEDSAGEPDPSTVANFVYSNEGEPGEPFNPVDIVQGPDGALYMPNFYADSIDEIRYFPGNQAPTANLSADKIYGSTPLEVNFNASGSTDPDLGEGDELHYSWDLNGDGEFGDATTPTVSHEYTEATNVTVKVRVSDNFSHTDVASVNLYPGDEGPPQVTIKKPLSTFKWAIGETVNYEATATDPDGETFGAGLTPHWEFRLEHCPSACHEHPEGDSDSATGSFVAPPHGYPSRLKFEITATDSRGMTDTEEVEISPRPVEVSVESDPAGLPLRLESVESDEPATVTMIAGGTTTVSAPERASVGAQEYEFSSWSDGLARSHEVTSLSDIALVAHFVPVKPHEEQPPGTGGGAGTSSSPPAPIGPPAPAPAHLRLTSKPPGVTLRLSAVRVVAPFSAEIAVGTDTSLTAPATIRRHGRTLRFRRWLEGGTSVGSSRRHGLSIAGDARYTAVYAAAKRSPAGSR